VKRKKNRSLAHLYWHTLSRGEKKKKKIAEKKRKEGGEGFPSFEGHWVEEEKKGEGNREKGKGGGTTRTANI